MFHRSLELIGYYGTTAIKDRLAYIVTAVVSVLLLFFTCIYLFIYEAPILAMVSGSTLLICLSCVFLYRSGYFFYGKLLMIGSLFMEVIIFTFLLFPRDTMVNIYLMGVIPATFSLLNYGVIKERRAIYIFNLLCIMAVLLSSAEWVDPYFDMAEQNIEFFKFSSLFIMSLVIVIVFHFYSRYASLSEEKLKHLASTDGLTNLANRRVFFEKGNRLFQNAKDTCTPFGVLMLDLDHFKRINDQYGHQIGDHVLKEITAIIKDNVRKEDLVARYGGEEFSVLVRDVHLEILEQLAEKIRRQIEKTPIAIGDTSLHVTLSVGAAIYKTHMISFDDMVNSADTALYDAKERGRNLSVIN